MAQNIVLTQRTFLLVDLKLTSKVIFRKNISRLSFSKSNQWHFCRKDIFGFEIHTDIWDVLDA